jgi:BirA family transcriptional regulator, biotin operon repressor / biotin---[acetyl-CoA-carboxylase] ligase
MPDDPASWSPVPDIACRLLDTRFRDIRWFTCIDSTNRYLLSERPAVEGVVAVADEQTAGRGRHGRTWTARPGAALLVSVLLRPQMSADRLHLVTLAAAVAATDALGTVAGLDARIKWPNDIVVGDRKLAGILAEGDGERTVVVGMGMNVRADAFPSALADVATAVDLVSDRPVDRVELVVAWLRAFDTQLDRTAAVVDAAAARSATLGRQVRVELARTQVCGLASRLTDEGFLVVLTDEGSEHVLTAGDVIHLRRV